MHVLVAGGSRGIGKAIVERFLEENYTVSYFYNSTKPEETHAFPIKCDCSSYESVKQGIECAILKNGNIDVLIYNAGISMTGVFDMFQEEDYHKIMDTNFGGLFYTTKIVAPQMIENHKGVIIAISSMWGEVGASCEALYSASKGAVNSYVKSLAKELGPSGITVNAISPGVIDTDMMASFSKEDKDILKDETPVGRLGKTEDIAEMALYLASSRASFITGQIISINGGYVI